ncbi:MAG: hypothetical protein HQL41_16025 [Alphaproteobacteria bacterium]|nr:hypothetical protein [Alphaproteobacteria bacterium]
MNAAIEGDFRFDFSSARVERLDRPEITMPQGMSLVDFVIEEGSRLMLLVEIKDPSRAPRSTHPSAQTAIEKSRGEFVRSLETDKLLSEDLVPKARDSYTYLHLMRRDHTRMIYVVLLGAEKLSVDPALLLNFKDRLLARIRQEAHEPWQRDYIADCVVVTERDWADAFPNYPLVRLSNTIDALA